LLELEDGDDGVNDPQRREVRTNPRLSLKDEYEAAIREYDLDTIQRALQAGANPNETFGVNNHTALLLACTNLKGDKCLEIVCVLLEAGADPNIPENWDARRTPLHVACGRGNISVVEALLEGKAQVDFPDRWNRTPLRYACNNGNVEMVRLLLKAGADPRVQEHTDGDTPMHIACEASYIPVVRALLAHDASLVRAEANGGKTPLHMVCRHYSFSLRVVRELVEHGADVTIKDKRGRTPYDYILARNQPFQFEYLLARRLEVVDYLLECYVERIVERHGRLSLHAILQEATYEKDPSNNNSYVKLSLGDLEVNHTATLMRLLIARIGDPTSPVVLIRDEHGNLPIHIASRNGAPVEVVRLLAEQDAATLHMQDRSGALPIHIACCQKSSAVEMLQWLMEQDVGALCTRTSSGALPIHVACLARASIEVFSFLLEQDPRMLQERDRSGALPIHLACRSGCPWRIIKCLADHGGEDMLAARNPNGDLPLHVLCAAPSEPSLSVLGFMLKAFPESVSRKNGNGILPFMLACETGKSESFLFYLVKKHPELFSSE